MEALCIGTREETGTAFDASIGEGASIAIGAMVDASIGADEVDAGIGVDTGVGERFCNRCRY